MNDNVLIKRTWLTGLIMALFICYPNIAWLTCDFHFLGGEADAVFYFVHFVCRFLYFWAMSYAMLCYNQRKLGTATFWRRFYHNAAIALVAFAVYEAVIKLLAIPFERFLMIITFQHVIMAVMNVLLGYILYLYNSRQEKEDELQQLKIESLQSQCSALTNQINPHFFFNALNGISCLVRKKNEENTLDYISYLSDIFRYVLQSGNKGLIPLEDELEFLNAYGKVLEVRYANKLSFEVEVGEEYLPCRLPVLSLLPLLENITVHNMIDSDHRMTVRIGMTEEGELMVSNPKYPKMYKPETHGTGLKNLKKRCLLLMDKEVRVESDDKEFKVIIPLM